LVRLGPRRLLERRRPLGHDAYRGLTHRSRSGPVIARALFAFALLMSTASLARAQITYIGSLEGHAYYRNHPQLTLTHSRAAAAALGQQLGATAYVACVTTAAEQKFLACATGGGFFWLGLVRDVNPQLPRNQFRWVWDSGEPYAYDDTFWCDGEPSDQFGSEDAGWIGWGAGGCWNDVGPWAGPGTQASIIEVVPAP